MSGDTVAEAAKRFQTAYERSLKAEDFAKGGKLEQAVNMWRINFGDYFPAYG
jgi:hypothetical protein